MKKNLRSLIIFAALGVFFTFVSTNLAQTNEPMAGGYQKANVSDAKIISAANFAVKTQAKKQKSKIKLLAVSRAEQQVVAGMNYNLCLQVTIREKGKKTAVPQTVQTVVFLNLKQKFDLTSWAVAACADEMPAVTSVKSTP
jgi:hypothetical protein